MIRLREMTADDWPAVERIYAQGIEDGEATFEVATPSWEAFDAEAASPASHAVTDRTCSYPVASRNVGARP